MEQKINIAELLKDCPKGMELDCTLFEGLEFDSIVDNEYLPIRCRIKNPDGGYSVCNFTKHGCWTDTTFAKCVIFPKGKTTWEGFVPPCKFEDGDIAVSGAGNPFILKFYDQPGNNVHSYCGINIEGGFLFSSNHWTFADKVRLATEEEKQKLFDAIKANGYKWNAETKKLEKLPKFKVGDRIKSKEPEPIVNTITQVYENYYQLDDGGILFLSSQDNWELVPNKFDISTLKPFDKVLYRMHHNDTWLAGFYDVCIKNKIFVIGLKSVPYCIPYEGNEHLLGTTNDCDEYYK